MKTDDFFTGNSELSVEFSKYVLEHPEVDDSLDENSAIIFLPDYSPQLREFNMGIAKELIKEGRKVTYVRVRNMKPRTMSALEGVEIAQSDEYYLNLQSNANELTLEKQL